MVLFDCVMHCGNPGYNVELCIGKQKKNFKVGGLNSNGNINCSKIAVFSFFQHSNYVTVTMKLKYYGEINILPK